MLHPIKRRRQTLKRSDLTVDDDGQLVRRKRTTLDDIYRRIDEDLDDL